MYDGLRLFEGPAVRFAHQRELADDFLVELSRPVAEGVVETGRPVENLGQLFVELADWKSLVGMVVARRAFDSRAITVPNLAFGIAWAHEQRELLFLRGRNHGDRVGLVKSGQVEKV